MARAESRRFRVTGRVQGVGFRFFVVGRAQELALNGFTRNRPDGSVEVFAQGPAEGLERLREALEEGPALARVEAVAVTDAPPEPGRTDFRIVH